MRIVVLVSGTGSNLQAVIDAVKSGALDVEIAAVGADRPGTFGVERSAAAGIPTFVVDFKAYPDRAAWNAALTEAVAGFAPDVVVSSGFMRIVSADFIDAFGGKYLNTHPALLPSFPGAHGVRDALAYGVRSPAARCTGPTPEWTRAPSSRRKPWRSGTARARNPCTSASRWWNAGSWFHPGRPRRGPARPCLTRPPDFPQNTLSASGCSQRSEPPENG